MSDVRVARTIFHISRERNTRRTSNMKNKCDCYHTQPTIRYTYSPITGQPIAHDVEVGVCWGTKETDECSCGGDRTKCDFYPEIRKKAKNKPKKIITNADRIRAMTDDELADFFYGSPEEEFGVCYYCKNFGGAGGPEPCKTPHGCCEVEDKNEAFKKWLRQPIKYEF
jgi:hypothetical protein